MNSGDSAGLCPQHPLVNLLQNLLEENGEEIFVVLRRMKTSAGSGSPCYFIFIKPWPQNVLF